MRYSRNLSDSDDIFDPHIDLMLKQFEYIENNFPELYACIDLEKVIATVSLFHRDSARTADFEATQQGGRGELYTYAQKNLSVRQVGITQLFRMIAPEQDLRKFSKKYTVLDALGGDGTLTRSLLNVLSSNTQPSILTSDISAYMVSAARAHGLPAIRQMVQSLVLKDNCLDASIVAYGSHHIPVNQRLQACQETFRVLKPGGHIVFHDFENASPVTMWFANVVHPYSSTGHNFPHFTSEELRSYLEGAAFEDVKVEYIYDPFILSAKSSQEAIYMLGEYLLNMYGLVKLADTYPGQDQRMLAYTLADKCFRYNYPDLGLPTSFGAAQIRIFHDHKDWFVEMPRVALVGTGVKPVHK
ncbi:hypothetical protein KSF_050980 [Reticulibacter mediterranei]|uniref:Methyltransferase domain-containing protein n=1 Tax=Reticulibacter mediterranei TaxID=2778369 RepID=A0A8J3N481_9CHLR|nr:class I SAM-dependent methyltransferase [Reticulibacter mediterranei]GHO95050.1 hypothetical protein KSF_050980 [Reticulibacter mediterranei]